MKTKHIKVIMFLCANTNYLKNKGNNPIYNSIKHKKILRNKGNHDNKISVH